MDEAEREREGWEALVAWVSCVRRHHLLLVHGVVDAFGEEVVWLGVRGVLRR